MSDSNLHPMFANIMAPHMPFAVEPTEADLERLNDAHQACLRAEGVMLASETVENVRAHIRATNVLVDQCIRCGMPTDYPDHETWAAERVARWLMGA